MRIHLGHTFHGAGNVGDDLMIAGFLRAWAAFGDGASLTCASPFDRASQQLRFPQITWLPGDEDARELAVRGCDVWVATGGPAFQTTDGPWLLDQLAFDVELCRRHKKPMFFLCVGASNRAAALDPRARPALDAAERVWTRDTVTVDALRPICGAKVTGGADLAHLYLRTRPPRQLDPRLLGWVLHFDNRSLLRLPAVADAIRALPDRDHAWLVQEVRNWPGTEEDSLARLPADVRARLAVYRPDYAEGGTAELLDVWPACGTVATSRYHAALASAWAGARVAVIERDDKLASAAAMLGCARLPAAHDAGAVRALVGAAQPVRRDIMEQQAETAWRCCAEFFAAIRPTARVALSDRTPDTQTGGILMPIPYEAGLTTAEVEQFHRDGFLGPFPAFAAEQMAALRPVLLDRVLTSPSATGGYPTQSRHLDSATVWAMCTAPAVVSRLKALYGPDLMLWYSNVFDKGPAKNEQHGEYPWHQDMWHWKIEPKISLCVWMAVTEATVENGCVEVIPGSHAREIPVVRRHDAAQADWFGGMIADPAHFDESTMVRMVMKPGEFFIFNEATLHHSNPNRTGLRRVGLSFRVSLTSVKSDRAHPCVMVCGTDKHRINPFTAPPLTDPDPNDPTRALPDGTEYTFDRPLNGLGWHLPERDGGTWLRWTGPATTSWLDVRAPGDSACTVAVRVRHAIAPDVLESLALTVNDHPVPLAWRGGEGFVEVEGLVPAEVLSGTNRRARVALSVRSVKRFCDTQPGNTDTRQLGLAVTRIALTPVPVAEPAPVPEPVQAEPRHEDPPARVPARRGLLGRVLSKLARR